MSTLAERYGRGGEDADPDRTAGYDDPYAGAFADHDLTDGPDPVSGTIVAQHRTLPHGELRADFGAHLETHYPRLVAQLYAITLHPGDAHEAVQDAYSRAWKHWSGLRDTDDVVGWVRRVAIRTSTRGWRQRLARLGLRRGDRPGAGAVEPRTAALLDALARLSVPDRRAIVLHHMAGLPVSEIAVLERTGERSVRDRLRRSRHVVTEGLADVLGEVVGAAPEIRPRHEWVPEPEQVWVPEQEWVPQQWDGTQHLPGGRA